MDGIKNFAVEKGFESISSSQMYGIENNAANAYYMEKVLMMENAGNRVSDFLIEKFKDKLSDFNLLAVCGMGNNGGDALVSIRHLSGYIMAKNHGIRKGGLSVILMDEPANLRTQEAKTNWRIVEKMDTIQKITTRSHGIEDIMIKINESDIIIDGILGTGIKNELKEPYSSIIELINNRKSDSFVLSVDLPSGMDPDAGKIIDKAVKANVTITFHRMKHGLVKNPEYCGDVYVNKIGIPWEAEEGILKI